ncbi:MAG: helix-turn-helix transcriptional regulator [Burkholderiaceae bacterium]
MNSQMLQGGFLAVMEASTPLDFRTELVRFGESLGFKTISATAIIDRQGGPEFHSIDNTPAAYSQSFRDPSLGQVDPVMQHCKHAAIPIIWDQDTYVSRGHADVWDDQARFGYRTGIALALHMPGGKHFFLGVDRDRPLPRNPRVITRIVADLQLFAVHAQDAAFRILTPAPPPAETPLLTAREQEALRWTMDGKTAWEVGSIMSISERTAVLHLQNAMHKLDCVTKHQAVLKAIRLGILS